MADAFEAMTAPEPGRRPVTPAKAREELTRCAGSQFDVAGGAIIATPPPTAGPPATSTTVAVEQRSDERGVIEVFSNQGPDVTGATRTDD